jgi:hypothetical protein
MQSRKGTLAAWYRAVGSVCKHWPPFPVCHSEEQRDEESRRTFVSRYGFQLSRKKATSASATAAASGFFATLRMTNEKGVAEATPEFK